MKKQQITLTKKKLVLAMSLTMAGVLTGCSSGSGGDSNTTGGDSIFSILMNGGFAGNINPATGGDGGEFHINNNGATGGVRMKEKGAADTDFKTPVKPDDPELGTNPLAITADTTLPAVDDDNPVANGAGGFAIDEFYLGDDDVIRQSAAGGAANFTNDAELATGSAYLRESDSTIGIADTATAATHSTATGLSVATGVTLTLGNNNGNSSQVEVLNDIENNGTITRAADGNNITLRSNTYFGGNITNAGVEDNEDAGSITVSTATGISNDGVINASGFNETDETGGDGDDVRLSAGGYIINNGMIDTSGGDGSGAGGDGERVDFNAAYTENNGAIDATGGSNISAAPIVAGNGGDGGVIEFDSDFGTNITAAMDTSGGDGSTGGDGGNIDIDTNDIGDIRSSGAATLNGGVGTENAGGDGGDFDMNADGGNALSSGDIASMGGNSIFANFSGGDGGQIDISSNGGEGATPPGDVVVSGNLNTSGGDALLAGVGNGGEAGWINLDLNMGEVYDDQRITVLGYMSINSHGGDGSNGGDGGEQLSFSANSRLNEIDQEYTVGSITNEIAINAFGGNSTAVTPEFGRGGHGGIVVIETSTNDELVDLEAKATNEGVLTLNGGNATGASGDGSRGGNGGELRMSSFHEAENKGAVTAMGADGGDFAGGGGSVFITTEQKTAKNSADLTFGGGDGAETGGYGGSLFINGEKGDNSGDVTANGGNATDDAVTTPSARGGNGGEITITGHELDGGKNSGETSLLGGTGVEDGNDGCIQVGITFEGDCS